MLSRERLLEALHYNAETGVFLWRVQTSGRKNLGKIAGYIDAAEGRAHISIDGKTYLASRLAWLYVHGDLPKEMVDHINCDPSDTRMANLRLATSSQNSHNSRLRRDSKTGVKGVSFHKARQKYVVSIMAGGKYQFLGRFSTLEMAKFVRQEAALRLHGEYARL